MSVTSTTLLPNFVIAGAPKSGTTSLFKWLSDHPDVCSSSANETFYLMDKEHPLRNKKDNYHDNGLSGYGALFRHCHGDKKIILECTTHYMYQQTAIDVLSSQEPPPLIVFMLRDPAKRVLSSYEYTRNNLGYLDRNVSFNQFVKAIRSGSKEFITKHCSSHSSAYVLINDIRYSRYIDYVERWAGRLGKEKILPLVFEELVKSPRDFMVRLSERLCIDPKFYELYDFKRENKSVALRNPLVHRVVRNLAPLVSGRRIGSLLKDVYIRAQEAEHAAPSSEDQSALASLASEFEPFNKRLSKEFDVDVSQWRWQFRHNDEHE